MLLQTEIDQMESLAANMKSDLDELERGRVCKVKDGNTELIGLMIFTAMIFRPRVDFHKQ